MKVSHLEKNNIAALKHFTTLFILKRLYTDLLIMDIQYFYSLVLICLLSANAYASTTSPAPSSQEATSVEPASTTVETDSSSAVAASSSIAPGASNDTTPPTTTTGSANASSTSVASQPDIPTTNIPSASTSATPVETSSNIPSSSSSSSSVNYSGTSNDVTSPGPTDNSSVSPTSPSSTSNSSLSTVDTTPTTTFISSVNPGSTSDASVNTSDATSASASSVTASNSASSTASPTPVTTNSSTPEEVASTSTPSSPSGSPASNASETPVESSTGGTSAGSDTNTSDPSTASSTPSTNPSSSAASDSSPTSTDSTASSQPTSTDAPVESTTVTPAAPVETTQPPLSTSFPSFAAKTDVARYQLSLAFDGDNNGPTTSCNDSSLLTELEDRLKTTDGYSEVIRTSSKMFSAVYKAKHLYGRMANVTTKQLEDAMSLNPSCFNYTAFNDNFQQAFGKFAALTDDYCKAEEICNTGYTCRDRQGSPLCISLCEDVDCQNGGACVVVVKQDGQAAAQCRCTDNNEQVFSGDKCEVAHMNPDRVAAIVGAVLGAFCFILLVALYCMCYRKRERSGQKYSQGDFTSMTTHP